MTNDTATEEINENRQDEEDGEKKERKIGEREGQERWVGLRGGMGGAGEGIGQESN